MILVYAIDCELFNELNKAASIITMSTRGGSKRGFEKKN